MPWTASSAHIAAMNQVVVQMYLLILVGVFAGLGAVRPRIPRLSSRWVGFVRFLFIALVGLAVVVGGFHAPGRVDDLRLSPTHAYVLEHFPDRMLRSSIWTEVRLSDGAVREVSVDNVPPARSPPSTEGRGMRLRRSLRARVERPVATLGPTTEYLPVGPVLNQPVLAYASAELAVVAAYEEVYRPETLFVGRMDPDGAFGWRRSARRLGLASGRLRLSGVTSSGDIVMVFSGVTTRRTWLARLTLDTRLVVVRLEPSQGTIRWVRDF